MSINIFISSYKCISTYFYERKHFIAIASYGYSDKYNLYTQDILNNKISISSYSFIHILSLTIIYLNNNLYLVVVIKHNYVVFFYIPSNTIIKLLALDCSEYFSSFFILLRQILFPTFYVYNLDSLKIIKINMTILWSMKFIYGLILMRLFRKKVESLFCY